MSFDVFLIHFREGANKQTPIAPIQRVIDGVKAHMQAACTTYRVEFPTGSHVELSCTPEESDPTMCSSAAFFMRGYDAAVLQFMIDVARAGNMVMFPAMESAACILVDEAQRQHVPADLGYELVVVGSVEELAAVLQGGFEAWEAYRNSVLDREDESKPD